MILKIYCFNISVLSPKLFFLANILPIITLFTFCSFAQAQTQNKILAEAGSKKITIHDFRKFLMDNLQSCGRIDTLSTSSMNIYLDSLINLKLMLCEAEKNNLEENPGIARKIHRFENELIADRLIESQVIDSIITLEKLRTFYEKYGGELRLRELIIRFKNDSSKAKTLVNNIYEKINNGLDFKDAAKQFSEDAMTSGNGGDKGFVRWGQLSREVQDAAFELEPGEISHPIKTSFGYYLIQVVSKIKCGFKEEVRNLKYQMAAYYARTIENNKKKYLTSLEKKYGLKLINSNIEKIAENVGPPYAPFESIPKDLYKIPLANFGDKTIRLNDLIEAVGDDDITNYRWSKKNISNRLSSIAMNKISVLEAESLGLNADEDVKRYQNNQIIDLVKSKIFDLNISQEELQNYYDKNKNDFVFPERIRVKYVVVAELFIAKEVFKMAKDGKNFDELVNNYTLDAMSRKTNGDIGFITRDQFKEIYDVCINLKIGEIAGPVASAQGFAVVKLLDKEKPIIKTLEEAKNQITQVLLNNKKQSAYLNFIKKLKSEFKVTINKKLFTEFMENPLGFNLSLNSKKINESYAKTSD